MEPIPTNYDPSALFFTYNLRSRREVNAREAANVRQFEHWQTDYPYLQQDRPDVNGQPILNDMNPTDSRKLDGKQYFQNATLTAGKDGFDKNPYFEGYAPVFDSRNAVRELRSAVFEDHFDRGIKESRRLLSRNFTTPWNPEDYIEQQNLTTLKAYESLKPKMDDITRDFRKALNEDIAMSKPGGGPPASINVAKKKVVHELTEEDKRKIQQNISELVKTTIDTSQPLMSRSTPN